MHIGVRLGISADLQVPVVRKVDNAIHWGQVVQSPIKLTQG